MEQTSAMSRLGFADIETDRLTDVLAQFGYVYIDDIPEGFDYARFLSEQLGSLMPQYDGQTVWSIKADKRFDDTYHSLNTRRLFPHTECYELDGTPPKFLALWCVVPNEDPGGQTTLADSRTFIATLSNWERDLLRGRKYDFVSTAGLQEMSLGRTARHPVLQERDGRNPVLRFTCHCVANPDDFYRDISARLQAFFEAEKAEIGFTAHSLLIWDNHRVLHSRNAFTDSRRHLRRVWIAENNPTGFSRMSQPEASRRQWP